MTNTMLDGIDVSKWNNDIDWTAIRDSNLVDFAFIRATYGCTGPNAVDPKFKWNWAHANCNVVRGAYHFLRAFQPGYDQAKLFLEQLDASGWLQEGDLSPMLDIEDSQGASPSMILKCIEDWLEVVELDTKRRPIIYTGPAFWSGYKLGGMFRGYPLCIAHYPETEPVAPSNNMPKIPAGTWAEWSFWQYTDQGSVPGIVGDVDKQYFRGDWRALAPMRTTSESTGMGYGVFPKAVRMVQRAVKIMPRVK